MELLNKILLLLEALSKRRTYRPPQGSFYRPGAFPGKRIPGGGVFRKALLRGRKALKPECPPGRVFSKGRCVRAGGLLKMKLARAARKRKHKILRKLALAKIRRQRTLRKRKALGLS